MNRFFTLLFLIISFLSFSQEDEINHDYYWSQIDSTSAMVGATNCYVRESADYKATILDSLQLGNEVFVEKSTENRLKLKGINVSWAQINYKNKFGIVQKGFVWKGFLALGFVKTDQNYFLTTIDKIQQKTVSENYKTDFYAISVKVLDKNKIFLNQKTIDKNISESAFFQNKTIGGLGLKNVADIFRISFSGEACGIPTYYFYFGWNGKKLLDLPEKYEVGDAGAYYYSEDFIFPEEVGGKPDMIIRKHKSAENNDETGNFDTYVFNVSQWTETYKWTGGKAVFIKKSKVKKSLEKG
jgi:hypothetical protein